jgi:hypothetical protein
MGAQIRLQLNRLDVGQILDGLRCRQQSWATTAIWLRDGSFPDESFVAEECSDWEEAQRLADWYQRIIVTIERQVNEQRKF